MRKRYFKKMITNKDARLSFKADVAKHYAIIPKGTVVSLAKRHEKHPEAVGVVVGGGPPRVGWMLLEDLSEIVEEKETPAE